MANQSVIYNFYPQPLRSPMSQDLNNNARISSTAQQTSGIFKGSNQSLENIQPNRKFQTKVIHIQQAPLQSYRTETTQKEREQKKWDALKDLHLMCSKAHLLFTLRIETVFLAYSIGEKTYEIIGNLESEQYWTAACLFIAMKYEEIYPPRLKQLGKCLIKKILEPSKYLKTEMLMMAHLDKNLIFETLNLNLSKYVHAITEEQSYSLFYLVEIALSIRKVLKKFSIREIVLSAAFVLCSHRIRFEAKQVIDGVEFGRIESCAKIIIVNQTHCEKRIPFLYKKYKSETLGCASLKYLPCIESLTAMFQGMAGKSQSEPAVKGLCAKGREVSSILQPSKFHK